MKVITPGDGKVHPAADEMVAVDYTIWTTDGKMFDSSVTRGRPATLSVGRAIPGLGEGLRLMVTGESSPALDSRIAGLQRPGRKTSRDVGDRCDLD